MICIRAKQEKNRLLSSRKIIKESPTEESNQYISFKGLHLKMKNLLTRRDCLQINALNRLVFENLNTFNPFANWEHFQEEIFDLLRQKRVGNIYDDPWLKFYTQLQMRESQQSEESDQTLFQSVFCKRNGVVFRSLKIPDLGDRTSLTWEVPGLVEARRAHSFFKTSPKVYAEANAWEYIRWKQDHLKQMKQIKEMMNIKSARIACGKCFSRIADAKDLREVPGALFCLEVQRSFSFFGFKAESSPQIKTIAKEHGETIKALQNSFIFHQGSRLGIAIKDFFVCAGGHWIGVTIQGSPAFYLVDNLPFFMLYPDASKKEFELQNFRYKHIRQREALALKKKQRELDEFVCFVCEQKRPPNKNSLYWGKHFQSKKHLANLALFQQLI